MAYKIGDKVRFRWEEVVGEVLEVRDENVSTGAKYLIKWEGARCAPDWEHGDELIQVSEAADKEIAARVQSKIDEAKTLLEQAWQSWQAARELADKESSLYYLERRDLIHLGEFGAVAEQFGWSSSSLYCP